MSSFIGGAKSPRKFWLAARRNDHLTGQTSHYQSSSIRDASATSRLFQSPGMAWHFERVASWSFSGALVAELAEDAPSGVKELIVGIISATLLLVSPPHLRVVRAPSPALFRPRRASRSPSRRAADAARAARVRACRSSSSIAGRTSRGLSCFLLNLRAAANATPRSSGGTAAPTAAAHAQRRREYRRARRALVRRRHRGDSLGARDVAASSALASGGASASPLRPDSGRPLDAASAVGAGADDWRRVWEMKASRSTRICSSVSTRRRG